MTVPERDRVGTLSLDAPSTAEAHPTDVLAPGERIDGDYCIERLLGEGSGGAVYLARHVKLDGARFAIKVLHGLRERSPDLLAREGRLAAEVRSAHVVKVTALGRLPRGAPYLVMEYVEGPTLDGLLADRDLVTSEAIDCARQLCLALEAAHAQGLVHGDVSLRNVFVTPKPDGRSHVQLGDFGLARRVQSAPHATQSVELGAGRGTPRFMAPEVISGDAVDARSDVFSVGVVLYRLLAGVFPFDGAATHAILTATLRGAARPLTQHRDAARAFEPAVTRCLALDPAARFQSVRALREALDSAARASPTRRSWRERLADKTARATPRGGVAVLVAAVALGSWLGVQRWRERARIPLGPALACPDTDLGSAGADADLARAVARALCARVGAALDLDWGGGLDATRLTTRLHRESDGAYRLDVKTSWRLVVARAPTPFAAALEAARQVVARAERPPMRADEIRRWGARDAESAAAVRSLWRRRSSLLLDRYESEPRAALARDPSLPLAHLLLAQVERDPARQREARSQALASADRLPPDRAEALRASLAPRETPETVDAVIERLRGVYTASPDDVDIGLLYLDALVTAGRRETAIAVVEQLHERFPRTAAYAAHRRCALPDRDANDSATQVEWLVEALPEARAATVNICLLTGVGRLAEADAALAFARRFGLPKERIATTEAVVALALGDPARIERATARQEGATQTWSQVTGAHLQAAGLLLRGMLTAVDGYLRAQVGALRARGDHASALHLAVELLYIARRVDGRRARADDVDLVERLDALGARDVVSHARVRAELIFARARDASGPSREAARAELDRLDAELARRAGADGLALAAARLRTLPLVRFARGDAQAAALWRVASVAWLNDRVVAAFDAAQALEAVGDRREAEGAYRLAMSAYDIDRHPFESVAARVRLADLVEADGRADEARELRAYVDRAWAGADYGLRESVRRPSR